MAAGLPVEVEHDRTEFRGGLHEVAGSFRRPLDLHETRDASATGLGWRRLRGGGALAGRVEAARALSSPGSAAPGLEPYAAPLIPTDTSDPPMRIVRAALDGAAGYRLAGWCLGAAAAFGAWDNRTDRGAVPRIGRASATAVSLSAAREIGAALRLGAYGRWQTRSENILLVERAADALVFELQGLAEPEPRELLGGYNRRLRRDGWGWGGGGAGTLAGVEWAAYGERFEAVERHSSVLSNDPPADRWTTDGWRFGAAARRWLRPDRLLAYATLERETTSAFAERHDLRGVIVRGEEDAWTGRAELRLEPGASPWGGGLAVELRDDRWFRRDAVAELAADIRSTSWGGAVEAARLVSERLALATSYSLALRSTAYALPPADVSGPVYRRLIAPELAYRASPTTAHGAAVTLRWTTGKGTQLSARAAWARLAPRGEALTAAPGGERTGWSVGVGVVLP